MKTVGIIGGSGFIGSHVTKRFLEEGYRVKVSATDISRQEKYTHLKNLSNADNLSLLPMRVENKEQLISFVQGCEIVIHGGTPFQLDVDDPKTELFDPTIKGTENFLEVVHHTPNIKKVVFIASVAAFNTNFPLPSEQMEFSNSFSEKSARYYSRQSPPYAQAKFIANQTVQFYIDENPKLPFEISTVSPVMVMGKSLSEREDSVSTGMQFLIKNQIAPNEFVQGMFDSDMPLAIVDVEDVADSIFKLATTKGTHCKDYLLTSQTYAVSDVRAMLNHQPPKNKPQLIYQNHLAETELGIRFRPVQDTLNSYSN